MSVSYTHLDVYKRQVQALYGQVVRVSPVSGQYINPMDLNMNYSEEDNPLSLKADFIPVSYTHLVGQVSVVFTSIADRTLWRVICILSLIHI